MKHEDELSTTSAAELIMENPAELNKDSMWESIANSFINVEEDPRRISDFVQLVSILRVGAPSLGIAILSKLVYPSIACGWRWQSL